MPAAYTAEHRQRAVEMYEGGATSEEVGAAFGVSQTTMSENLRNWGAKPRRTGPRRRLALKEDFFSVIDTEEKAYWLGFLAADGCVSTTGAGNWLVELGLQRTDRNHLIKFKAALGFAGAIDDYDTNDGHPASRVRVACGVMATDLRRHGLVPNKTQGYKTPEVPADLRRHYYRGFFDGDGTIFAHQPLASGWVGWTVGWVGPESVLEELKAWIFAETGLPGPALSHCGNTDVVMRLLYNGRPQPRAIASLLYSGAAVFLDRKHQRYLQLISST